jgi:hypothetical protein
MPASRRASEWPRVATANDLLTGSRPPPKLSEAGTGIRWCGRAAGGRFVWDGAFGAHVRKRSAAKSVLILMGKYFSKLDHTARAKTGGAGLVPARSSRGRFGVESHARWAGRDKPCPSSYPDAG